jgi:hypothetical protein
MLYPTQLSQGDTVNYTTNQQDYFLERLDEVFHARLQSRETELFGAGGQHQPTWGQVFAAIRSGEITLAEGTEDLTRAYLMPTDVVWPARQALVDELAEFRRDLELQLQRAQDRVMLTADQQAAIREFEKA